MSKTALVVHLAKMALVCLTKESHLILIFRLVLYRLYTVWHCKHQAYVQLNHLKYVMLTGRKNGKY